MAPGTILQSETETHLLFTDRTCLERSSSPMIMDIPPMKDSRGTYFEASLWFIRKFLMAPCTSMSQSLCFIPGGLSEDSASSWLLALIEDSILEMISFSPGPTSHSPRRSWYVAIHCGLQRGTSRDWCTKPSMRIREQVSCEDCSNRLIANAIRQPKP